VKTISVLFEQALARRRNWKQQAELVVDLPDQAHIGRDDASRRTSSREKLRATQHGP
jgi:hypothetical protein